MERRKNITGSKESSLEVRLENVAAEQNRRAILWPTRDKIERKPIMM